MPCRAILAKFLFSLIFSTGAGQVFPILSAQDKSKADYVWIFGYYDDGDSTTTVGPSFVDFKGDPPPEVYYKSQASGIRFDMYLSNTSYSDEQGELLMYTNGSYIYDAEGHIIPNGDSLSPSQLHWENIDDFATGHNVDQGHFFLSMPNHSDTVWLFHQARDRSGMSTPPYFYYSPLHYSKIHRDTASDALVVVEKNTILEDQSLLYGPMTATRHANGRDWWIIVTELDTNVKRLYLLTPSGLHFVHEQQLGPPPDNDFGYSYIRQNVFSPDGSYFARFRYFDHDLNLYTFDRCTGTLTFLLSIQYPKDNNFYPHLSFSPNNRFLYASREFYVFQYDLWAEDILASKDTVGIADTTTGPYEYHQLGPDGKIYINAPYDFQATGNNPYIHVIHAPDEKGDACQLENNAIILPTDNFHSMPHFPNYRLGVLEGSPCDTLTATDEPPQAADRLNVYPVPSDRTITIEGLDAGETVFIYNIRGRLMDRFEARATKEVYPIDHLPAGMYWIRTVSQSAKFIRLR